MVNYRARTSPTALKVDMPDSSGDQVDSRTRAPVTLGAVIRRADGHNDHAGPRPHADLLLRDWQLRADHVVDRRSGLDCLVVGLAGEIDAVAASDLRTYWEALFSGGYSRIVVGLRNVKFLDVAGLRSLLEARTAANHSGSCLIFVEASRPVRKVFCLVGMEDVLNDARAAASSEAMVAPLVKWTVTLNLVGN